MLNKHNQASRKVAVEIAEQELNAVEKKADTSKISEESSKIRAPKVSINKPSSQKPPSKYELNFKAVKQVQREGLSKRAISRRLRVNRETVSKYFEYNEYHKRITNTGPASKAPKYADYLKRRWKNAITMNYGVKE